MYLDGEKDCMKAWSTYHYKPSVSPDRLYFSFFVGVCFSRQVCLTSILQFPFQISVFKAFLKFLLAESALPVLPDRTF